MFKKLKKMKINKFYIKEIIRTLTLSKIIMIIGALGIVCFSLLYATNVVTYNFYGWKENGSTLIILAIMYMIIPFSVKPGFWAKLWTITMTFIAIFNLLNTANIIKVFEWEKNGTTLIIPAIMYMIIPFSVKPDFWAKLWAIVIINVSVLVFIGIFVGSHVDYKSVLTYINALPHIIMAIGCLVWIVDPEL